MSSPKVLLIYTGGTIGMVENADSSALHPVNFDQLIDEIPELSKLDVEITVKSIEPPIDSSNMQIANWIKMAEIIEDAYLNFDGFVILHGSDTMAYTGSALSFLLENLNKAVILTGSQLPIGKIRTDGKENLITAIEIAAAKMNGKSLVPEVAIYFEYSLYRANRTTKLSAEHFEAFQSPNYPLLVEAGVNLKYNNQVIHDSNKNQLRVHKKLDDNIASIKIFPGIRKEVFQSISSIPNLKGLILETYGGGNAPQLEWLIEELKKLMHQGVLIVNISQCVSGSVDQSKYETGRFLEEIGVLGGKDLTYEAAISKLMFLLASDDDNLDQKKDLFLTNLRGEMMDA